MQIPGGQIHFRRGGIVVAGEMHRIFLVDKLAKGLVRGGMGGIPMHVVKSAGVYVSTEETALALRSVCP